MIKSLALAVLLVGCATDDGIMTRLDFEAEAVLIHEPAFVIVPPDTNIVFTELNIRTVTGWIQPTFAWADDVGTYAYATPEVGPEAPCLWISAELGAAP